MIEDGAVGEVGQLLQDIRQCFRVVGILRQSVLRPYKGIHSAVPGGAAGGQRLLCRGQRGVRGHQFGVILIPHRVKGRSSLGVRGFPFFQLRPGLLQGRPSLLFGGVRLRYPRFILRPPLIQCFTGGRQPRFRLGKRAQLRLPGRNLLGLSGWAIGLAKASASFLVPLPIRRSAVPGKGDPVAVCFPVSRPAPARPSIPGSPAHGLLVPAVPGLPLPGDTDPYRRQREDRADDKGVQLPVRRGIALEILIYSCFTLPTTVGFAEGG